MIRDYLPTTLVVRAMDGHGEEGIRSASNHLASLVGLMRMESTGDKPGGYAMLNSLTTALLTLPLRAASESEQPSAGLLALAGHPRLATAISAMFADPARPADALAYTCKHLNLDLAEATCVVPRLGNGLRRCLDPFGQFIEPM